VKSTLAGTGDIAPPVAIGGVGGSGTRIVAELARAMGIHTGTDLNAASDTLWFTLLFKRREILSCTDEEFTMSFDALRAGLCGGRPFGPGERSHLHGLCRSERPGHSVEWLSHRAASLEAAAAEPMPPRRWGWKEPNTHVVIERLWQYQPDLRYIHVVRHGVDMAFSANQNQLILWGPSVLGNSEAPSPVRSLAYWCHTHRRIQRLLAANPRRMYWLDYDALCREPVREALRLAAFLECDLEPARPVLDTVRPPAPPRHAGEDLRIFPPDELAYVRSLGYVVDAGAPSEGTYPPRQAQDPTAT